MGQDLQLGTTGEGRHVNWTLSSTQPSPEILSMNITIRPGWSPQPSGTYVHSSQTGQLVVSAQVPHPVPLRKPIRAGPLFNFPRRLSSLMARSLENTLPSPFLKTEPVSQSATPEVLTRSPHNTEEVFHPRHEDRILQNLGGNLIHLSQMCESGSGAPTVSLVRKQFSNRTTTQRPKFTLKRR